MVWTWTQKEFYCTFDSASLKVERFVRKLFYVFYVVSLLHHFVQSFDLPKASTDVEEPMFLKLYFANHCVMCIPACEPQLKSLYCSRWALNNYVVISTGIMILGTYDATSPLCVNDISFEMLGKVYFTTLVQKKGIQKSSSLQRL